MSIAGHAYIHSHAARRRNSAPFAAKWKIERMNSERTSKAAAAKKKRAGNVTHEKRINTFSFLLLLLRTQFSIYVDRGPWTPSYTVYVTVRSTISSSSFSFSFCSFVFSPNIYILFLLHSHSTTPRTHVSLFRWFAQFIRHKFFLFSFFDSFLLFLLPLQRGHIFPWWNFFCASPRCCFACFFFSSLFFAASFLL